MLKRKLDQTESESEDENLKSSPVGSYGGVGLDDDDGNGMLDGVLDEKNDGVPCGTVVGLDEFDPDKDGTSLDAKEGDPDGRNEGVTLGPVVGLDEGNEDGMFDKDGSELGPDEGNGDGM